MCYRELNLCLIAVAICRYRNFNGFSGDDLVTVQYRALSLYVGGSFSLYRDSTDKRTNFDSIIETTGAREVPWDIID